eukprot:SAG31_NODE_3662_length_4011_cov_8.856851_2_plen_165_part_00
MIVMLFVAGSTLSAWGEEETDMMRDCCTVLEKCQFAETGCVCIPHHTDVSGQVMVPETNAMCPASNDYRGSPNATITCLDSQMCAGLDQIPANFGFVYGGLTGFILGAFIFLIPCLLATVGCVYGYQLYSHPTFGRPVVVQTQYPVAAATVMTAVQAPPMAPMG